MLEATSSLPLDKRIALQFAPPGFVAGTDPQSVSIGVAVNEALGTVSPWTAQYYGQFFNPASVITQPPGFSPLNPQWSAVAYAVRSACEKRHVLLPFWTHPFF